MSCLSAFCHAWSPRPLPSHSRRLCLRQGPLRARPRFVCALQTTKEGAALAALQNGSDVRGIASEIGGSSVTLSAGRVAEIARAFVKRQGGNVKVAIGRDSRISGPALEAAAASGARAAGADVTLFGIATTPAMFMSTVLGERPFDCAMMLTASHLPPDRNGIKFFTRNGSYGKKDVREILEEAELGFESRGRYIGMEDNIRANVQQQDFIETYAQHLVRLIREGANHPEHYDTPLKGFRIVVDAGNGAAGFFATRVLTRLGADVIGQFLEPDGMFPNHVPNPEDPTAMAMTVETTRTENADLGVVFDTDVDRSGVVDSEGMVINRNRLIALLARIVLRQAPGSTIVTDSVTSNGLKRFIEKHGGKHFRYRKGYKNVIDKGIELNKAGQETLLAIETSGHGAMRENYMLDDGAYLAVKIIIEMVRLRLAGDTRGIGGLLDGLDSPMEEREFRLGFFDESSYKEYGARVVKAFNEFARNIPGWTIEEPNYEGVRVNVDEGENKAGWLLLRQSLHDPLLPLNIESEISGGIAIIAQTLVEKFFCDWPNVNIEILRQTFRDSK